MNQFSSSTISPNSIKLQQHHRSNSNPNPKLISEFKKEQDRKTLISKWQNGLIQQQSNITSPPSSSSPIRKTKSFIHQPNSPTPTKTQTQPNHTKSSSKDLFYSTHKLNRLSTFTENGSSIDNISSNSFPSTINTSITSSQPKSGYQPRPLLLLSFNQANKSNISLNHSTSTLKHRISNLEKRQLQRHQEEIIQELKIKRKQERLDELSAISSKINPSYQNPDDDHWDWLSSDSDYQEEEEDVEEPMEVVWRASLDVGRKVSKNRKALGKSSAVVKKPNGLNHHSTRSSIFNHHSLHLNNSQSILFNPISLLKSYFFNSQTSFKNSSRVFLFGSGILAGVFSSVFSSLILGSSFIERSNLGFFINFLFPSDLTLPNNLIGWSAPHLIRLTGIGIYYQC